VHERTIFRLNDTKALAKQGYFNTWEEEDWFGQEATSHRNPND